MGIVGEGPDWAGRVAGRPPCSNFDSSSDRKCTLKLDAEVSHGAIHLRVSEEQLNGAKVSGFPIVRRQINWAS